MKLGARIRRLSQMRRGVLASALLAALVAVWSVQEISLSPPSIEPRSLDMATAATHVVVDTPTSALLDLRQDTYRIEGLTNRAVLLGNVVATAPLRESIARRAGIPAGMLRIDPPITPKHPRMHIEPGNERQVSDIARSTDQYRLSIQANPTVPILDIYAQTPTAASAAGLANAAVDAMSDHVARLAASERTPRAERVRLVQLDRAEGAVVNDGMRWQLATLAFLLTFGAACATLVLVSRLRDGWVTAARAERAVSR